ncbi:hypothetical protein JEQ12_013103 [Ovis aries]|uniref:CUB domain-containing protein n=1 Tax=Ovis aries TaxID=9940 RepID=A0A836CSV0_SHEEP|nr:hypothetical protein JEQ12_013103 [Ovis aries]
MNLHGPLLPDRSKVGYNFCELEKNKTVSKALFHSFPVGIAQEERSVFSFNCFGILTTPQLWLSGFQLPSSIVSSGSILTLWFTTDFAVSAQGFKALYEEVFGLNDEGFDRPYHRLVRRMLVEGWC